ncbi:hypothetical protein, conserved [Angomonas deanei]|uniref:Uncharacterized protein n=1 Tax=Angomonas deanei TaxID=59799 RepID=A0A7G2C368_9TRYP|nr:hypothetical protein, conserved [Angomonas deanei]
MVVVFVTLSVVAIKEEIDNSVHPSADNHNSSDALDYYYNNYNEMVLLPATVLSHTVVESEDSQAEEDILVSMESGTTPQEEEEARLLPSGAPRRGHTAPSNPFPEAIVGRRNHLLNYMFRAEKSEIAEDVVKRNSAEGSLYFEAPKPSEAVYGEASYLPNEGSAEIEVKE